jgi:hypothetical protein
VGEGINESFPLRLPTQTDKIWANIQRATVSFSVDHFTPQQAVVPLELHGFPADSSVQVLPKAVMVKYFLRGGESAPPEDIRVKVDFKDLKRSDSVIRPSQILPATLQYPEIHPPVFKVVYANHRSDRRDRNR